MQNIVIAGCKNNLNSYIQEQWSTTVYAACFFCHWNCIFKLNNFLCAGQCKECKNFNSMFAIVSGLGHGAVSRLRLSWEKLPSKYQRLFSDLQDLMDPSRNMSKYRQLVSSEQSQPPIVSQICFCIPLIYFHILCKFPVKLRTETLAVEKWFVIRMCYKCICFQCP
jgi:hypothetical protein